MLHDEILHYSLQRRKLLKEHISQIYVRLVKCKTIRTYKTELVKTKTHDV